MREVASGHVILAGDDLPSDVQVQSYQAHEAISMPYVVDVEISTGDPSFRIDACLQRRMLLEVGDVQGGVRHYDGLPDVSASSRTGAASTSSTSGSAPPWPRSSTARARASSRTRARSTS